MRQNQKVRAWARAQQCSRLLQCAEAIVARLLPSVLAFVLNPALLVAILYSESTPVALVKLYTINLTTKNAPPPLSFVEWAHYLFVQTTMI